MNESHLSGYLFQKEELKFVPLSDSCFFSTYSKFAKEIVFVVSY